MMKFFNQLRGSIATNLHDALPILLIVLFYQMTILEIPLSEIVGMLGWIVFVAFGLTMIL
ncbi:hypothetical protein SAMN05660964_00313 [Thiothrix caldifontis]|uniref:Uncharacterized protein n=1 Tax=Thiothrix caldifontis TaxID=525918 RepID=A0A1H3W5Z5_9GAMM|nr:hypothetical protein [Thiothrix caldifontis]SDZ82549.1 hypothetical protein SAMN05660964_00313 [Thiothrix caldifontis]